MNNDSLFSKRFGRWEGFVDSRFNADFLGIKTRHNFFSQLEHPTGDRMVKTHYPPIDEEYYEWEDLITSIEKAKGTYRIMDIGAGWGRWLIRAAFICKHLRKQYHLYGVEADKTHYGWMIQHFSDNDIEPQSHCLLFGAASGSKKDGAIRFARENPYTSYGQSIIQPSLLSWRLPHAFVPAINVAQVIDDTKFDLLDLDIQGEEYRLLNSLRKVLPNIKCVHIETHNELVEKQLDELVAELPFEVLRSYPSHRTNLVCGEQIYCQGGLRTWLNKEYL